MFWAAIHKQTLKQNFKAEQVNRKGNGSGLNSLPGAFSSPLAPVLIVTMVNATVQWGGILGVPLAFWDEWQKQSCQLLGEQKEQPVLTMLVKATWAALSPSFAQAICWLAGRSIPLTLASWFENIFPKGKSMLPSPLPRHSCPQLPSSHSAAGLPALPSPAPLCFSLTGF